jgi:hypothetical protein
MLFEIQVIKLDLTHIQNTKTRRSFEWKEFIISSFE